ncbi:IclR family pca regulon transcriptional regulator [Amycolatopsis bartoniae]|uniref:IclR family transcriptional regulator n=1 Tax=Amycolatopsis bartoniae TaxID=941986 RepID=A0A8H9J1U4_9PSEU|nr:IclR family transcriptional regulator C-terminal domain-containing protein [Amycolatopsis bartoniae]MBB2936209.1 IclR family pca regulon transcriptional regulator [Amycolatopsis bartoniae]TVT07085.1 helix-turn-helix domain-containing protein [Amycolatopsis bartoniae]GHF80783.1 IclR family transcriptional regulator [Amycolatopsis bartoniae]
MSREDPDVIDSVEKAFRLLQSFSAERPAMTVSGAAAATGLTRATARRILLTLERLGFAETDGREFRLTPGVLRLGYGYLAALPFWEHAQPHLRALSDELREASSMATLDGGEIVYVVRVPASRSMTITLNVGSRLPAYPTSMGRVLLAALPDAELESYLDRTELERLTSHTITDRAELRAELQRVREQGYAVVDGEREEGVRSAAAPVRGSAGQVLAALNVSANAARVSLSELRTRFVPRLLETAEAITKDIAGLH